MDQAPFDWEEDGPSGGLQGSSMSFGRDGATASMTILVDWLEALNSNFAPYIVGYSEVTGTAVGGWQLHRQIPARHPIFQTMRCTKILGMTGVGVGGRQPYGNGFFGQYQKARVSLQFELMKYFVLDDATVVGSEYRRYVTKSYKTNLETLARRGQNWNQILPGGIPHQVVGDVMLRQAKGYVEWVWHQVPIDWLLSGKLTPTNINKAVGTVNLNDFPHVADNDITSGLPVQYKAGTLLLMPVEFETTSCLHPNTLKGEPTFDPRCYNVTLRWLHFDPPLDPDNLVACVEAGNMWGGPGQTVLPVQGHQLLPLPNPLAPNNFTWYPATNAPTTPGSPPLTPIPSDRNLLYPYFDHEQIFKLAT